MQRLMLDWVCLFVYMFVLAGVCCSVLFFNVLLFLLVSWSNQTVCGNDDK